MLVGLSENGVKTHSTYIRVSTLRSIRLDVYHDHFPDRRSGEFFERGAIVVGVASVWRAPWRTLHDVLL